MTPIAVYDANVLYPSPLRDFLIRVAIEDLVRARWSERILDEVFRNIAANRPDRVPARLARTRARSARQCWTASWSATKSWRPR